MTMGDPRGFIKHRREHFGKTPVSERVRHHNEFLQILPAEALQRQGARCMDCGVPFCHSGCPLGNIIPDWNDLVYRGQWREALERLHATNNFPEFTGRVCPAPCETACVLGINEDPVTIKQIEVAIADRGFEEGWIAPEPPAMRTGKTVAIVGSGPAGLAAAQQLCRAGHDVTVFERADRPGGLLMYGIPDFKLEKHRILRRVEQMEAEGVTFQCNTNVGVDVTAKQLAEEYDAVLLCGGSTQARDLPIPGRDLDGVHFAMEFLPQQNKRNQRSKKGVRSLLPGRPEGCFAQKGPDPFFGPLLPGRPGGCFAQKGPDPFFDPFFGPEITATDKDVVVIGGGDTGSDCVGTSVRQGCRSLAQFEIMPMPPDLGPYPRVEERPVDTPWPHWPMMLRTTTSHEEGADRNWSILTKEFHGDENGQLTSLSTVEIEWYDAEDGRRQFRELPGTETRWPAQLVLLAMGFVGPEKRGAIDELDLELDARSNIQCDANYRTSTPGVFAAGDIRRGQSLVVWALLEGREAARTIDHSLMGTSNLPSTNAGDFAWR